MENSLVTSVIAEILSPYELAEFFEEYWTLKSVFIPNNGRRFKQIFSWQKLNDILNFHEFDYPSLRLAKDGEVLPPKENAQFLKHCQEGATLVIDRLHKLVPEVAHFAAAIKEDLGHPLQVNMYCSWPQVQGFKCHYDTHEVFILQVDGCKEWHIFADTVKYPVKEEKSSAHHPPDSEPVLSCILEPGDVLYIPRGHWHYAKTVDKPSLHLTLGIHCLTGIDFLQWLTQQLQEEQEWRINLPILNNRNTTSLDKHLEGLTDNLTTYLQTGKPTIEYSEYLANSENLIPKYAFPYQAGYQIFAQGINTKFIRPKYQRSQIVELPEQQGYQIIVWHKEITLKGVPKSFVEQLFKQESFTGADVASWLPDDFDWELDIAPTLRRLVTEGIIFVANT
ncbi:MAG: cupin domain-containing protein [Spirulinaceae cyanobacterium]